MFANFREAFKKDKQEISVPKEILEYLNSELPKDFKYAKGPDGAAILTIADMEDMKMQFSIEPQFMHGIKLNTQADIIEYAYRTQQVIPLAGTSLTINGVEFDFSDLIRFPLAPNKELKDLYIQPQPFPDPFAVTLQGGQVEKLVMIVRKPYADMHKVLLGSVEDEPFTISYVFDELSGTVKFNFHININKSKSIKEIVESLTLYDAFQKGSGKISGYPFPPADASDLPSKENQESLSFWNNVYELEKKLNVSFIPELPLAQDDAQWFLKLHYSLIEEKPFKEYVKMEKFNSTSGDVFKRAFEEDKKKLSITFVQESELTIMGVSITIFESTGVFNFEVKDVIDTNQKNSVDIIVEPVDEKGIYTATRIFLKEDDALAFTKNHSAELRDAEESQ